MPPSWGCLCSKECYLDPSVAMVIRDMPCDFVTLEAIMISSPSGVKPSNRHRQESPGITICFLGPSKSGV